MSSIIPDSGTIAAPAAPLGAPSEVSAAVANSLSRRYAAEKRFQAYGIVAIAFATLCLAILFIDTIGKSLPAWTESVLELETTIYRQDVDPNNTGDPEVIGNANYGAVIRQAMRDLFPDVTSRQDRRDLMRLVSPGATYEIRQLVLDSEEQGDSILNQRVTLNVHLSDLADQYLKGSYDKSLPESQRPINDKQIAWLERLEERGLVSNRFNWTLFEQGDSRSPELAGIRGALIGSFWTMLVTLILSFPLAVGAAIYLEEFAPKNRWTDLIEVNINNLAAVPSIVFGLLGLAVFLNFFGMPRSTPLVGGLVLTLMTLPTIIIASRAALKSVPPSIREAALGVGASKVQTVFHHVVPLALPGMLTGTIIGMAQALGETAPLLMIGMVAFIVDIPSGPLDASTVMPVQIYLWSDLPERAYEARAAAAIVVLLAFLIAMNTAAVFLRRRFERKW